MSKKHLKKLKKSSLFSIKSTIILKEKLEKEAKLKEEKLKKEFKNMPLKEIEELFKKYLL